jgi:hypothetical protein
VTTAEVRKPRRGRESLADMVRSLGLVAVVVVVTLLFVPQLFHPGRSARYPAQNYSDVASGFQQVTGRPALRPVGLPSGWAANAAGLSGSRATEHLHIGFGVPGSSYAGIEESVLPLDAFATSVLGRRGATVTGVVPIAGVTWQQRVADSGEPALTRVSSGVAVVVTGSASPDQLRVLAGSLR